MPKEGVDSFLSVALGQDFDRGMLVYTGELTPHSHTKLDKAGDRVVVVPESELTAWPVDWDAAVEGESVPKARKSPRAHQLAAVNAAGKGFVEGDPLQLS